MINSMYAEKIPPYIKNIMQALLSAGYKVYIVGGAVRDLLLEKSPGDFDLATDALPEATLAICHRQGWSTIDKLGSNFGCIVAIVEQHPVEITTFRGENYGQDAHRPDKIWYCRQLKDDLSRRDFTVNAMAMDIHGQITDYFNGQQDLRHKLLRTVGNAQQRYEEDALRMLRACRFVGQLGFTYVQQKQLLPAFGQKGSPYYLLHNFSFPTERCAGLSLARVKKELDKLLLTPYAGHGLMLFLATGLANSVCSVKCGGRYQTVALLPELQHLAGLHQNPRFHCFDTWEHTLKAIDNSPQELTIRWSLLLHDIGKGLPGIRCLNREGQPSDHGHEAQSAVMAEKILTRLQYPEKFIREVVWLVAQHMRFAPMLVTGRKPLLHWIRTEAASAHFRSSAEMAAAYSKLTEVFLSDMGATNAAANTALMQAGRELSEQVIAAAAAYPVHTADLKLSGKELLQLYPKADLKYLLNYLLQRVQSGNLANDKNELLTAVQKYLQKRQEQL